ncbi:MAG: lysophospholipid acyltransferase family protein [Rickettsiaceae bacterium]|nr:lysophospholipid acyltransferase family protein [Rickettsiaceae bacterium]MDP4833049.1 lysophospholipid acyltransferase family protein [Rickettsiaceae bacterium]MDP5020999.1 lysophospholipid acyltransferase family protein [Rickettsiaceae bacterium]MDP5082668.1 lysophospholipid acyltransferase family protein [Rickettsiaceae bacterium]
MIKKSFKHFLKNSPLVHKLSVGIIFLYLKVAYLTNKWIFIWPEGMKDDVINAKDGILFAIWHNRLAFSMHICRNYDGMYGLASPHTDGKLITDVVRKMGYGIIEGSTNRKPIEALRGIIKQIQSGNKVVITPDGPRGPVYKVNSSITRLGKKYNKEVIPISCIATKYFELKSWDRMIIPKNFGKIVVIFGKPLQLSGDEKQDSQLLEDTLMELSSKAELTMRDNIIK